MGWLTLAGVCLAACACGGEAPVRPNLVLITAAPLGAETLACYGGPSEAGAEICGLGETGARYSWAFTPATEIAPTAASLLTSLYPWRHGVSASAATFLRDHHLTVQERLHAAGYATGAFVAAPSLNRSRNLQQGFDVYDDWAEADPAQRGRGLGERALAWADAAQPPFFLWIHFDVSASDSRTGTGPGPELGRLDRRLSQLIAVLDAAPHPPGILLAGLRGDAPVLRTGAVRDPAGHIHPTGVRVPLLWREARAGSGYSVGRRVTTPVSLIDIGPTLLRSAGLAVEADLAGQPLPHDDTPSVNRVGESKAATRSIFVEHALELAVVADGEWAVVARANLADRTASASDETSSAIGRTAGLWPQGDRRIERTPRYDTGELRVGRLERLVPRLEQFSALQPPAEPVVPISPTP
jgi:hypothetical protein